MVKLSISLMAHQSRAHLVRRLTAKLGDPPVAWDEIGSRWDTGRRALQLADPNSDRHLVVQDDAIIPPGFIAGVRNALQRVPPDSPLVLFCTRTRYWAPVLDAVPADASYLIMSRIWWGVSLVVPTYMIPDMVAWCDTLDDPHYDRRLGSWFHHLGIECWYSWPNLADHYHVESLIPGRSSRRFAHNFVRGRADRVTWTGPAVKVNPPRQAERVVR